MVVSARERPRARGKFLYAGDQKLVVKGVTYGPFRPDSETGGYPPLEVVESDFRKIFASGFNAVRTYSVPPMQVLDAAWKCGLRVMVGLAWEQHIAFLDERRRTKEIVERARKSVRSVEAHPAILAYAVGNEIPSQIVRWLGRRRVERFLRDLCETGKSEDPEGLFTYVNYPSTEYLDLPFLSFTCFNVYLESQTRLKAYLSRLQNIAGDRPLLMGELGLDSHRNGEAGQAEVLEWQIKTAFRSGCAGAFVFSWTDEWFRGGSQVDDWGFGLTNKERRPKPALEAAKRSVASVPFGDDIDWPMVSVVVCTRNGAKTLPQCLTGLEQLDYPCYEIIVVDDGSTDDSAALARTGNVRVIRSYGRGLSVARNFGLEKATGEIIAYIDDDAFPERDWLKHLAWGFIEESYVGIGGPNIPPENGGLVAAGVARSPGGPLHVLISDDEAEHIPGCNMAFRTSALRAIGGFDPRFETAGDDVDVCWRLRDRGWKLGFSPAAMVWHRRRDSVRAFWRQQKGYGNAEAQLEAKWPERHNTAGHLTWAGRVYGAGYPYTLGRGRIYQGTWGLAPFQLLYQQNPGLLRSFLQMPEWNLAIVGLAMLLALGFLWSPMLWISPFLAAAIFLSIGMATKNAFSSRALESRGTVREIVLAAVVVWLHLIQPAARLVGRMRGGLTPWRSRRVRGFVIPVGRSYTSWTETWISPAERLEVLERLLRDGGSIVSKGGPFDHWDLKSSAGALGGARLAMTVEEHGAGRQLERFRTRAVWGRIPLAVSVLTIGLATLAALDGARTIYIVLIGLGVLSFFLIIKQVAAALALMERAINESANDSGKR